MESEAAIDPVLTTLKRDLHIIDHTSSGTIWQSDVDAFVAKPGKSSEDSALANFLHDHYKDILKLTDSGGIGQDTIQRFEDILNYKQGPGAAKIIAASTVGGAAGGLAGTAVDSQARLGDYGKGGGKGAAVGLAVGAVAAGIKEYQDNAMTRRQEEIAGWHMEKYRGKAEPENKHLQYEHFNQLSKILPALDVDHNGFLDKTEIESAVKEHKVPAHLLPELHFVEDNLQAVAKLANGSLEHNSPDNMVSTKDINALYTGIETENSVGTTANLAALGSIGAVGGGVLGAVLGAGGLSVPGAALGAAIGSSALIGLGHMVMKATDSYGRDERNQEREHIYRQLHAKIEQ